MSRLNVEGSLNVEDIPILDIRFFRIYCFGNPTSSGLQADLVEGQLVLEGEGAQVSCEAHARHQGGGQVGEDDDPRVAVHVPRERVVLGQVGEGAEAHAQGEEQGQQGRAPDLQGVGG